MDDGTLYDTPNGKKTLTQMQDGLHGAGWGGNYDDPAAVIAAYNSTAAGTSNGGSSSSGGDPAQNLLDAIASGNQERFDEAVKEFNQNFAENQRQFNTSTYSQLAQSLLNTSAQLRGPQDYFQFQKYTSGGRDLFQQLFGDQPRADFSAPTGQIVPETIDDLMKKLGFIVSPSGTPTPTTGGAAGTYNTVNGNKTLDQMKAELKTAGWGGDPNDTNAVIAAYASTTKGAVTPVTTTGTTPPAVTANVAPPAPATPSVTPNSVNTGVHPSVAPPTPTTPISGVAASVGAQPRIGANPTVPVGGQPPSSFPLSGQPTDGPLNGSPIMSPQQPSQTSSQPVISGLPTATQNPVPITGAQTTMPGLADAWKNPLPQQVPLPYQINPAVWDSMGGVGQALALSAAEAAGWDKNEYLRQINAARPQGTAPASSTTQFRTQMGAFS